MFDYRVSPAFSSDLKNLPDALITVGDQDFLLSSVREYAQLLNDAGNTVKLIVYKDTNHAFIDNVGNCAEADDFIKEAAEFIQK
jgi:acetyl esterase/lipase